MTPRRSPTHLSWLGTLVLGVLLGPGLDGPQQERVEREIDALLRRAYQLRDEDLVAARANLDAARRLLDGHPSLSIAKTTKVEKIDVLVLDAENRRPEAYNAGIRAKQAGCGVVQSVPCPPARMRLSPEERRSIEADLFDIYPHIFHYLRQRGLTAEADRNLAEYVALWDSFRGANPCLYADNLSNVLWTLYQSLEDHPGLTAPLVEWRPWIAGIPGAVAACRAKCTDEPCPEPCNEACRAELIIHHSALATLVAFRSGEHPDVGLAERLRELDTGDARHRAWFDYLTGMSRLADGDDRAAAALFATAWKAHRVIHRTDDEWPGWLTLYYRAVALDRAGEAITALAAYEKADRTRWTLVREAPLVGDAVLPTSTLWLASDHVDLRRRSSDFAGALCTARLNVANYTAAVATNFRLDNPIVGDLVFRLRQARKDLDQLRGELPAVDDIPTHGDEIRRAEEKIEALERQLPQYSRPPPADCEGLAPPARGQAQIMFHPLPDGGALAVALGPPGLDGPSTLGHAALTPEELEWLASLAEYEQSCADGPGLLDEFAEQLADAHDVCIFAAGSLAELPLHTLPFAGVPLGRRMPVAYCHDLPREPVPTLPRSNTAMYIGPPADVGNNTRKEFAAMQAGYPGDVRRELPMQLYEPENRGASVLVLSMHKTGATFRIGDSELHASDAAYSHFPPQVVVLACSVGQPDHDVPGDALTLAQGALLGGAWVVVGPNGPITPGEALEFQRCLFDPKIHARSFDLEDRAFLCVNRHPELFQRFRVDKRSPIHLLRSTPP